MKAKITKRVKGCNCMPGDLMICLYTNNYVKSKEELVESFKRYDSSEIVKVEILD